MPWQKLTFVFNSMERLNSYRLLQLLFLTVAAVLLLYGCNSFDPDFERDHPLDPRNPNFVHSKPEMFKISIENEAIEISWEDRTEFNDGYLIEKAINDSTQFGRVATLPKNAEQYTDASREIGLTVFYRISTFEKENDVEKIVHSETLSLSVNVLMNINIISNINENKINLSWQEADGFIDGIRIEEKIKPDSTFQKVKEFDFVNETSQINSYNYSTSLKSFKSDIRLAAFQYQGDQKVDIEHIEKELFINQIGFLNIEHVNERETRAEWESHDFADYYIYRVSYDQNVRELEIDPEDAGVFIDTAALNSGQREYSATGVHRGVESNTISVLEFTSNDAPKLSHYSKDLESVDLIWESSVFNITPSEFVLEKKVNNGAFEKLITLPPEQQSYTDFDLNPSDRYAYRVQTLISNPSNELQVSNQNLYTVIDESEILYQRNFFFNFSIKSLEGGLIAVNETRGNIYPLLIFDRQNLEPKKVLDFNSHPKSIDVSFDGEKLVEFVEGEQLGSFDLKIRNINSGVIDKTIETAHANNSQSNVKGLNRFSKDGNLVISAILHSDTDIKIWDANSGEFIDDIILTGKQLVYFKINPANNELIVITDHEIFLYDLSTFEMKSQVVGSFANTRFIHTVSNSGDILYSATDSNYLSVIDLNSGDLINELEFGGNIRNISLNSDDSEILVSIASESILLDANNFNIKQRYKWDFFQGDKIHWFSKDQFTNAYSLEKFNRNSDDDRWLIKVRDKRPHWFYQIDDEY